MSFADRPKSSVVQFLAAVACCTLWLAVPLLYAVVDMDRDSFMGPKFSPMTRSLMFPGSLVAALFATGTALIIRKRQNH